MPVLEPLRGTLRALLHQLARPAREDEGDGGLVIEAYRGYGTRHEIYCMGRVYRQPGGRVRSAALRADIWGSLVRLLRRGAGGRAVTARFAGAEQTVTTDADGYFRLHLTLPRPPPSDRLWHSLSLRLGPSRVEARAQVFIPPARARFVVISDIDDTVMFTGVANKAKMLWRLFAQGAESRLAFPGVGALYRALHGDEQNPMLYVSRGPWSIYSMLEAFFQLRRIPIGPVLFLREWGISLRHPLPRRAENHKLELIRTMLSLYRELPFVLIGDSGQHDPEIYARIVREHPGRVRAVYIRNVSKAPERIAAVEALALELLEAGAPLLLAADSLAMAEHAAALGLVPPQTPGWVAGERAAEHAPPRRPLRAVRRGSVESTRRAVSEGELEQTLEQGGRSPPSALVESQEKRERR